MGPHHRGGAPARGPLRNRPASPPRAQANDKNPQRRPTPPPPAGPCESEEPDTLTVDDQVFVKDERREQLGSTFVASPDATRN